MPDNKFPDFRIAHHPTWLWTLALIITLASAVYQRLTGPTYPVRGKAQIGGSAVSFKLLRSETVTSDAPIVLQVPDSSISGYVLFRRYNSHDPWSGMTLWRENDKLLARLPRQPAAGKLMYYIYLTVGGQPAISLTGNQPVVLRYKGEVPGAILIPHVFIMFLAMLISNRAGLEALDSRGNARRYIPWTVGLLFLGGFILGPLMQKFAFGEYWTGVPFGYDLTDNKTLLAMFGWLWAWGKNRRGKNGRGWILFAALLMLAVYLIPHSVLGSELDYTRGELK